MHSTLPKLATLFGLTLLIIGCGEPENIKTHTETKTFPAKGVLSGTDVEVYFGHFLLEWRADYSDQNKNDIMDEGEIINGTYTLVFYAPVEITWDGYLEYQTTIEGQIHTGIADCPPIKPNLDDQGIVATGTKGLSGASVLVTNVLNPAIN